MFYASHQQTNLQLKPVILHETYFNMQLRLIDLPKLSTCRINQCSIGWNKFLCVCVCVWVYVWGWRALHHLLPLNFHFITFFHIPYKPSSHTGQKHINLWSPAKSVQPVCVKDIIYILSNLTKLLPPDTHSWISFWATVSFPQRLVYVQSPSVHMCAHRGQCGHLFWFTTCEQYLQLK